jgi:DNA-binding NarL/FixJ family response regulator
MAGESIRVLVADDQAAVREGLATLLDLTPGIEVVGQARDGAHALELVAAHAPDVVLMDLHMPGMDGIAATGRVTAEHPGTRVVVLTTYADDDSIQGALRAGALGYLTKDADRTQIARAVQAAANGQSVLDEAVARKLVAALGGAPVAAAGPAQAVAVDAGPGAAGSAPNGLTAREVDVLRLIAAGRSNPEIARELFVSEATVKTHVNHVFAKTGARDRAQAVRFAYQHGLVGDAR